MMMPEAALAALKAEWEEEGVLQALCEANGITFRPWEWEPWQVSDDTVPELHYDHRNLRTAQELRRHLLAEAAKLSPARRRKLGAAMVAKRYADLKEMADYILDPEQPHQWGWNQAKDITEFTDRYGLSPQDVLRLSNVLEAVDAAE